MMTARHRLRPFSLKVKQRSRARLAALRIARRLQYAGVLAHHTATLPGVAAHPASPAAINKLIRFKQRSGPFLLLTDSIHHALSLARYCSPALRRMARKNWPGAVTLLFIGKPGLPRCCYHRGMLAVRVDACKQTRILAKACGGFLLSSSLNRRGKKTGQPDLKLRLRQHRFLDGCLPGQPGSGKASTILRVWRNDSTIIRP